MAVEIRGNDKRTTNLVGELSDMETLLTVAAERAFMRTLVRLNLSDLFSIMHLWYFFTRQEVKFYRSKL